MLYRRLLQQLSMVFGPVKKSSENVYISQKTRSINTKSPNCLKIKIISKN